MQELHAALLALQEMDTEIARAQAGVEAFTPQLQTLLAPVTAAERELAAAQAKLEEMRAQEQDLEKKSVAKWERYHAYQERLTKARGMTNEAALRSESELVRKAAEADDFDRRQLHEQATRMDLRIDELTKQVEKLRAETADGRNELEVGRLEAQQALDVLRAKRENEATRLDPQSRRLYERLRTGKTKNVLAPMHDGGACGSCFNILPLQEQVEVNRGERLHRCEACGVILYAP